ncbi:MAG: Crp/Fnr family transcriptional regulator [Pseudomonadota bacterium]
MGVTENAVGVLRSNGVFAALADDEIDDLIAASSLHKVTAGNPVFSYGDTADAVFFVLSGEIAIEPPPVQGKAVQVATLKPGAILGEISVLDGGGARSASALAAKGATLLRMDDETFLNLLAGSPKLSLAIIKGVIAKLRSADRQVEDITFQPLRARLASFLLKLTDGSEETSIVITQAALANRLSATREKVNRRLQTFQQDGAIKLRRGRIDILDREKLSAFAHRK